MGCGSAPGSALLGNRAGSWPGLWCLGVQQQQSVRLHVIHRPGDSALKPVASLGAPVPGLLSLSTDCFRPQTVPVPVPVPGPRSPSPVPVPCPRTTVTVSRLCPRTVPGSRSPSRPRSPVAPGRVKARLAVATQQPVSFTSRRQHGSFMEYFHITGGEVFPRSSTVNKSAVGSELYAGPAVLLLPAASLGAKAANAAKHRTADRLGSESSWRLFQLRVPAGGARKQTETRLQVSFSTTYPGRCLQMIRFQSSCPVYIGSPLSTP